MYKKDDYIIFMTKEPEVHLNEMFGYNNLTEDDFKETEHTGVIMQVYDDSTYMVMTVHPLEGFCCTVYEDDILRLVDKSELLEDEKATNLDFL